MSSSLAYQVTLDPVTRHSKIIFVHSKNVKKHVHVLCAHFSFLFVHQHGEGDYLQGCNLYFFKYFGYETYYLQKA